MTTHFSLFPRSRSSFDVNDIERFAGWLLQQGYLEETTRNNLTEYARFRGAHNGLIIIYRSGAVVLGGPAAGITAMLLLFNPLLLADDESSLLAQARLL